MAVEALRVAGVQAGQHRAPDVVQNGGQRQFVPVAVADDLGDSVGRPLHSQGVHPEAVGTQGEPRVAAEHVVRGGRAQNRLDGTGAKPLDRVGNAANPPAALELAGGANDRTGEPDVCLGGSRDLVRGRAAGDQVKCLIARFVQRGLLFGLIEGRRQNAASAFAAWGWLLGACRRCGRHTPLIGTPLLIV